MMRIKTFARIAAALAAVLLLAVPTFAAARGSADFTRLVILGDSYGAGVENGSLNEVHQPFSWGAQLARQVGAKDFQIPTVSYPGIGPDLQLTSIAGVTPTIITAPGLGSPTNLNLPRPYNNLSIPGAKVGDLLTLTGKDPATSTAKTFAQFILRGLGTPVQQALAQQPTFIAFWIGGNDALGALLAGTPALLTPVDTFKTQYNALLDALVAGAPNAGMVTGTLPTHIAVTPFATTIPTVIINPATGQPVLNPANGQPIPYFADLGGGKLGVLPPGSFVLLSAQNDLRQGFGIPPTLKNVPPFNLLPHAGEPLPDIDVVTPDEAAAIEAAAAAYNKVITDAAAAHNIPVADIAGLFDRVLAKHEFVGPFSFTGSYITGGFFSLDGFHLTDIGYGLFTNEFIKAINDAYGTRIPFVSLAQFFQNNGALFPKTSSGAAFMEGDAFNISLSAIKQIRAYSGEESTGSKFRATSHDGQIDVPFDGQMGVPAPTPGATSQTMGSGL
jgi:GDSL-like Lipase/Acylhydrolase